MMGDDPTNFLFFFVFVLEVWMNDDDDKSAVVNGESNFLTFGYWVGSISLFRASSSGRVKS